MERSALPETHWSQLSRVIAAALGLSFPPERRPDLQRGIAAVGAELGFADVAACVDSLLAAPLTKTQVQVLATHLTISETYFFREKATFAVFADQILPQLIESRRGRDQRLRLWSAACSSGEEAYSLAIMLQQLLPDLADWRVTILATDVNVHSLHKAVAASYGEWSFRDTSADLKQRYFQRTADGRYVVAPRIRRMVTCAQLNLVADGFPSLVTGTNAMDVIFCRNALMYFTPAQMRKVIGNLHLALLDGGWLATSPSEASRETFPQFVPLSFPGGLVFKKTAAKAQVARRPPTVSPVADHADADLTRHPEAALPPLDSTPATQQAGRRSSPAPSVSVAPLPVPYAMAVSLYEKGRYAEAVDLLLPAMDGPTPEPLAFSLLARALANLGRLPEALTWCDRWLAVDKVNSAAHYFRAIVLLEEGEPEEARRALQRAVFLQPDFVLAHFALGNLARRACEHGAATRHFRNTLYILARHQSDDVLPESDGLNAGQLTKIITTLTIEENT